MTIYRVLSRNSSKHEYLKTSSTKYIANLPNETYKIKISSCSKGTSSVTGRESARDSVTTIRSKQSRNRKNSASSVASKSSRRSVVSTSRSTRNKEMYTYHDFVGKSKVQTVYRSRPISRIVFNSSQKRSNKISRLARRFSRSLPKTNIGKFFSEENEKEIE